MFSYFGSKNKLVKYYPEPKYNLIIEPFAGSAQYSCYYKKKSILNDSYEDVYSVWNWLINFSEKEYILKNKDFYLGDDLRKLNLNTEYKKLLGFLINRGSAEPKNIVTKWSCQSKKN